MSAKEALLKIVDNPAAGGRNPAECWQIIFDRPAFLGGIFIWSGFNALISPHYPDNSNLTYTLTKVYRQGWDYDEGTIKLKEFIRRELDLDSLNKEVDFDDYL